MEGCLTFFISISYAKGYSLGPVVSYSHSEGVALHKRKLLNEAAMNSWNALQTTETPWEFGIINPAPSVRKAAKGFWCSQI
jgi:hypothetical protein